MAGSIRRTAVFLLLLGGSAILILGLDETPESSDVAKLLPKTSNKPLTALLATDPVVAGDPGAAVEPAEPKPLSAPIPLPPAFTVRAVRAVRTTAPKPKPRPRTRTMRMLVTAYCPCKKCCGKFSDNVTANGKSIYANGSMFVAADTRLLKFGTKLSVPGYKGGRAVPVWDRGGKIKGRRIDVFYLSHSRAKKWGRQYLDVKVYR